MEHSGMPIAVVKAVDLSTNSTWEECRWIQFLCLCANMRRRRRWPGVSLGRRFGCLEQYLAATKGADKDKASNTWEPDNIFKDYRLDIGKLDCHFGLHTATVHSWMSLTQMRHIAIGAIRDISTPYIYKYIYMITRGFYQQVTWTLECMLLLVVISHKRHPVFHTCSHDLWYKVRRKISWCP